MSSHGFKAGIFRITPRYKVDQAFAVDDAKFGPDGMLGDLIALMKKRQSHDDQKANYIEVRNSMSGGRLLLVDASGGGYGDEGEVVNRLTGHKTATVSSDDVYLRNARTLFVVPPYGDKGVVITEVVGRSNLLPSLVKLINNSLAGIPAVIRIDREVVDAFAWSAAFESGEVTLSGVELIQTVRSKTRNMISDNVATTSARLFLGIDETTKTAQDLIAGIYSARQAGESPGIARMLGLRDTLDDDDFDQESVVVIQDGRDRRINLSRGWPSFVYWFDEKIDGRPDDEQFLTDTLSVAASILDELDLDMPGGWVDADLDD